MFHIEIVVDQGNNTYWPGGDGQPADWYWSKMHVYGDGGMHVPSDIFDGGGPFG